MTNYGFDRVIVFSGEDSVNNLVLEFFGSRASLQYKDEENVSPRRSTTATRDSISGKVPLSCVREEPCGYG